MIADAAGGDREGGGVRWFAFQLPGEQDLAVLQHQIPVFAPLESVV